MIFLTKEIVAGIDNKTLFDPEKVVSKAETIGRAAEKTLPAVEKIISVAEKILSPAQAATR